MFLCGFFLRPPRFLWGDSPFCFCFLLGGSSARCITWRFGVYCVRLGVLFHYRGGLLFSWWVVFVRLGSAIQLEYCVFYALLYFSGDVLFLVCPSRFLVFVRFGFRGVLYLRYTFYGGFIFPSYVFLRFRTIVVFWFFWSLFLIVFLAWKIGG